MSPVPSFSRSTGCEVRDVAKGYFITGTDTGVGKTLISCALLHVLNQRGLRSAGLKPIASGAMPTPEGLRNEDALALQAAAGVRLPYPQVNPYCFEQPIAPHIAARQADVCIELSVIVSAYQQAASQADIVIVEGVGGWLVPINAHETTADLARALGLPVILVVGVRLGCLNHALLTHQGIAASGLPLAGWVANIVSDEAAAEENIHTLQQRWPDIPLLGVVPRQARVDAVNVAGCLVGF